MNIRKKLTIIINCIIAISTAIIALTGIICATGKGQLGTYIIGLGYFKPYTMDSNILSGIVALIVVIYCIKNRNDDSDRMPRWLTRVYLMGTTCLVLTFLIAAMFLAPMEAMSGRSYFVLFSGDMFFFHFLNPILATISLVLLLKSDKFTCVDRFVGMIPTIVYSIVYFVMVVVLKCWDDFYNFTFGGRYYLIPIVIIVIYGVTYVCSYLLTRAHDR